MEIIAKRTFLIDRNKISIKDLKDSLTEWLNVSGLKFGWGMTYVEVAAEDAKLTNRCCVSFNKLGESDEYSCSIVCFDHDITSIKNSPLSKGGFNFAPDSKTIAKSTTFFSGLMSGTMIALAMAKMLITPGGSVSDKNEIRIKEDVIAKKIYDFLIEKDVFVKCPKCGRILSKITQMDYHEDDKSWLESAGMAVAAIAMIVGTGGHGGNGYWAETKRTRNNYRKYKSYPCGCEWTEHMGLQGINVFGNEW